MTQHSPGTHDHPEHPDAGSRKRSFQRLTWALFIGIGLFLAEIIGSALSGSLALLGDAFHVLGDLIGLGVTLLAGYLATRPATSRRSYGYYRIEVLAALINAVLLILLSYSLIVAAIDRLQNPRLIEADIMLAFAVAGLVTNIFMLLMLRPARSHSINVHGAYLHVLGDTLSSVAVVASGIVILFTDFYWLDAAATFVVALMIVWMAIRLLLDSSHVLLEGAPKHVDPEEVMRTLQTQFPQIKNIHDFHIWVITSHLFAMTAHIEAEVTRLSGVRELTDELNKLIRDRYGIGHTTFQIEPVLSESR